MKLVELENTVIAVIGEATDGQISFDRLRGAEWSLPDAGMTSISFLVMIELLETRLGVIIEPDVDPDQLLSVPNIVSLCSTQLKQAEV